MKAPSYEQVERLLAEDDPQGLIKMGAPGDEYRPEARFIADWIAKSIAERNRAYEGSEWDYPPREVQDLLYGAFVLFFTYTLAGKYDTYEATARKLHAMLQEP